MTVRLTRPRMTYCHPTAMPTVTHCNFIWAIIEIIFGINFYEP